MYVATYNIVYADGETSHEDFDFQTIDEAFDFVAQIEGQEDVDYCEMVYYEFVIR